MVFHSNAAGILQAEPTGQYLHLLWHEGQREDALIKELFDQVLTHLQHTGWRRIIVNQQSMQSASDHIQSWFSSTWLPTAASQLGSGRAAIVVGKDVFTRLSTVSLMRNAQLPAGQLPAFAYQLFHYEQEAKDWLLS